jgi:hypothetical protein
MQSSLTWKKVSRNKLDLAKEAIKMFVSKLRLDDSFGLVIFNTTAQTILPCSLKKDIDLDILYHIVDTV